MPITQDERLAILQDVSRAWLELSKAVRQLSDEQIVAPNTVGDWSVKDLMGHISFWEQHLMDNIMALDRGGEPGQFNDDVDTTNRDAVDEMADMALIEIREQFGGTHTELMELLETTPHLARQMIAGSTYEHYTEHTPDVRGAKK